MPAFFALLATGSLVTLVTWRGPAADAAELRRMNATHLPEASRLATAVGKDGTLATDLWHVSALAALDRKAFVPTFFTTRGQSTMRLNPAYGHIGAQNANDGAALHLIDVVQIMRGGFDSLDAGKRALLRPYRDFACDFDYLATIAAPQAPLDLPSEFVPVATGAHVALYRIQPKLERGCPPR
jgi:hypothetical protein